MSATITAVPPPPPCRYYARGICRFGEMCRFSHDDSAGDDNDSVLNESGGAANSEHIAANSNDSTQMPLPSTTLNASTSKLQNWVNAPVFIPKGYALAEQALTSSSLSIDGGNNRSWAEVAGGSSTANANLASCGTLSIVPGGLCPYESNCPYGEYCRLLHIELCEMCDTFSLHPTDQNQRRKHIQECIQQHERDMELSFAIARSKDKSCGICFDTIMEKSGREKRFGILPNCSHIFCLECIRKWRQAKQFEHKITRSCPECRVASDFVCPSAFWVDTKEEKDKLLTDYRSALGVKDCKYFKKGDGKCPFGNKCFYKHALPSGELVDVGLPKRTRKLHRNTDELIDLLDIYLWEFVDQRDIHHFETFSTDSEFSDDSEWS